MPGGSKQHSAEKPYNRLAPQRRPVTKLLNPNTLGRREDEFCCTTSWCDPAYSRKSTSVTNAINDGNMLKNQDPATASCQWNAAILNVINYTCDFSDLTCQNVFLNKGPYRHTWKQEHFCKHWKVQWHTHLPEKKRRKTSFPSPCVCTWK